MGVQDILSRKSGVIVGDDVLKLFNYAQEHKFAIPAIVSLESIIPLKCSPNIHRLTYYRTALPPPPSSLPSRLLAMQRHLSSSKCPKEVLPTSPERYIYTYLKVDRAMVSDRVNIGCCQRQTRGLNCRWYRCCSLHPCHCPSIWHSSRFAHRSLRQEAPPMAGWSSRC